MASTTTATLYTTDTTTTPTTVGTSEAERPKFSLRSLETFEVDGVQQQVVYDFEVSPNEVNLQRLGLTYAELERPGRRPLLLAKSPQLQQISLTALVTSHGTTRFFTSCQAQIDGLVAIAGFDGDFVVAYPGVPATLTWRITDLSIRTVRRDTMNEVTIAEADITLTESVVADPVVPGMPTIKDIPAPRSTAKTGGGTGGTTDCQKYSGPDQSLRDPDTKCRIQTIVDAGKPPVTYVPGIKF